MDVIWTPIFSFFRKTLLSNIDNSEHRLVSNEVSRNLHSIVVFTNFEILLLQLRCHREFIFNFIDILKTVIYSKNEGILKFMNCENLHGLSIEVDFSSELAILTTLFQNTKILVYWLHQLYVQIAQFFKKDIRLCFAYLKSLMDSRTPWSKKKPMTPLTFLTKLTVMSTVFCKGELPGGQGVVHSKIITFFINSIIIIHYRAILHLNFYRYVPISICNMCMYILSWNLFICIFFDHYPEISSTLFIHACI